MRRGSAPKVPDLLVSDRFVLEASNEAEAVPHDPDVPRLRQPTICRAAGFQGARDLAVLQKRPQGSAGRLTDPLVVLRVAANN